MDLTVLLCTYNRCQHLPVVLDSLLQQDLPRSVAWEIVVVDNNSKDETRAVVKTYCDRYPTQFRYLLETEQGLSRARNAGIRAARGSIIAFVDDDIVADPAWLRNLTATFHDPTWAGAGGPILPLSTFRPPAWMSLGGELDLGGTLALFDLGKESGPMKCAPFGTNMAFRKSCFEKYGGFRTDLGRCGNALLSGEDTEFGNRLFSAGERIRYVPAAVIRHPVPEERLKKRYFRSWWFDFGRTRIIERTRRKGFCGIPREYLSIANLLCRLLPIRLVIWLFTIRPPRRFYLECQIWMTLGEIVENYHKAQSTHRRDQLTSSPGLEPEQGSSN